MYDNVKNIEKCEQNSELRAIPGKWGASCVLFIFRSNIEKEMVLGVFGIAEHEFDNIFSI